MSLFELSTQSELQRQKREAEELKAQLAASLQESSQQRAEHQALLAWKAEKEALINQTEAVQSGLQGRISHLENTISQLNKDQDELKVRALSHATA